MKLTDDIDIFCSGLCSLTMLVASQPAGWFVLLLLQSLHAHLVLFDFDKLNLSGGECSSVFRV